MNRGRSTGFFPRYTAAQTARYKSLWLRYQRSLKLNPIPSGSNAFRFKPRHRRFRWHEVNIDAPIDDLTFTGESTSSATNGLPEPTTAWKFENPLLSFGANGVQKVGDGNLGEIRFNPPTSPILPRCFLAGTPNLVSVYFTHRIFIRGVVSPGGDPPPPSGRNISAGRTYEGVDVPPLSGTGIFESYTFADWSSTYADDRVGPLPNGAQVFSNETPLGYFRSNIGGFDFYFSLSEYVYMYRIPAGTGADPHPAVPCADVPLQPNYTILPATNAEAVAGGNWVSNTINVPNARTIQVRAAYSVAFSSADAVDSLISWSGTVNGSLVIPSRARGGSYSVFTNVTIPKNANVTFTIDLKEHTHTNGALFRVGGAYTCTCPDYARRFRRIASRYRSELRDRSWVSSGAGSPGLCKHIMAVMRLRGESPTEPPTDDLEALRQWRRDRNEQDVTERRNSQTRRRTGRQQLARDRRKARAAERAAERQRQKDLRKKYPTVGDVANRKDGGRRKSTAPRRPRRQYKGDWSY